MAGTSARQNGGSAPDGGPVVDASPEAIVRGFLHALEDLDGTAAARMVADDILYENKGLPKVRGRAQFERAMSLLENTMDGFEARMVNLAVDGDVVLTERVDVLRKGGFVAEFWVCGTFEVREGRIVVWRDYFDFVNVSLAFAKGLVRMALDR